MVLCNWQYMSIFPDLSLVNSTTDLPLQEKLLAETARVSWAELERLFAAGKLIKVGASLDLIAVAQAMAEDDADTVRNWMQADLLGQLDDATAERWARLTQTPSPLWAVVVNPWVLVQEREAALPQD